METYEAKPKYSFQQWLLGTMAAIVIAGLSFTISRLWAMQDQLSVRVNNLEIQGTVQTEILKEIVRRMDAFDLKMDKVSDKLDTLNEAEPYRPPRR